MSDLNPLLLTFILGLGWAINVVPADLSEIERDALALELFLQDKQDHDKFCPHLTWEQPPIEVYKETLESQLPSGCKP